MQRQALSCSSSSSSSYPLDVQYQPKSYRNFINALNSEVTKRNYHQALLRFITHYSYSIQDIDELVKLPVQGIESMIINRIIDMQQQEKLSVSSVTMIINALQHFYSMNDIILNWKKVRKFVKTDVPRTTDEAYTHEDISKLMAVSDSRMKMVILIFASTGIRVDALHSIKLRNLTKIDSHNLYKIVIYEGYNEQYLTFCTPECTSVIDSYLDYRRRSGEILNDNSYLVRELFDSQDLLQVKKRSRHVSTSTIRNTINAQVLKAGIREASLEHSNRKRHKKALVHGFRKFFTNQLVNSKVNPEIREMLLGHKIGLASAYYRPTEEEMLNEYLKAVDNLTINEENRLKRKVEKLEVEKSLMDQLRAEVFSIKQEMAKYKQN